MKKLIKIKELSELEMSRVKGGAYYVFWTETCTSYTQGVDLVRSFYSYQQAQDFMMDKGSYSCVTSMSCSYGCDPINVFP
jgi:natural product precursor